MDLEDFKIKYGKYLYIYPEIEKDVMPDFESIELDDKLIDLKNRFVLVVYDIYNLLNFPFKLFLENTMRLSKHFRYVSNIHKYKNELNEGTNELNEVDIDAKAWAESGEHILHIAKSEDSINNILGYLTPIISKDVYKKAFSNILNQSLILIWSVTENNSTELIRTICDNRKDILKIIMNSPICNNYVNKKVSFEDIYQFINSELNTVPSSVFIKYREISTFEGIKACWRVISGENMELIKYLNSDLLYKMFKTRNLIAHKAGVIDEKYKQEVNIDLEIGDQMYLTSDEIHKYFLFIIDFNKQLFMITNDFLRANHAC